MVSFFGDWEFLIRLFIIQIIDGGLILVMPNKDLLRIKVERRIEFPHKRLA